MSEAADDGASDPVQWFSLASTISIAIGILLIAFGLLVPTNYSFDSNLPARQMESVEIFYFRLSEGLAICLVVGMALVTLGGVIQIGIIINMYRQGELDPRPDPAPVGNCVTEMTGMWQGPSLGRNYGTRDCRIGDGQTNGTSDVSSNVGAETLSAQEGHGVASHCDGISEFHQQQPR